MLQKTSLVSVIVLVSDHEENIYRALDSVMNQTYPSLEVIIINDATKERSSEIIKKLIQCWHPDNPFKRKITFIQHVNKETSIAINLGLYMSSGDFLTILPSDDSYHLTRIENLVNSLNEQKTEWGFTAVQGLDQSGNPVKIEHDWHRWYEKSLLSLQVSPTVGFSLLEEFLPASAGNLIFSRSIYQKVGEFKRISYAYDYDYALRLLLVSEPIFIHEKLYSHQTDTQKSHFFTQEQQTVYQEYLQKASSEQPMNRLAPCEQNWSADFKNYKIHQLKFSLFKPEHQNDFIEITKKMSFRNTIKKSKKVTLISESLNFSDENKIILDLAIYLKNCGCKVNVIAHSGGSLKQSFENQGIKVCAITDKSKFWFDETTKMKKVKQMLHLLRKTFFNTKKTVISFGLNSWSVFFPLLALSPFRKFYWYILDSRTLSSIDSNIGVKIFSKIKNKPNLKTWFSSSSAQEAWKEDIDGEVKYWSGISTSYLNTSKKAIKNILSVNCGYSSYILLEAFIECIEQKLIPSEVTLTLMGFLEWTKMSYPHDLLKKLSQDEIKQRINFESFLTIDELQTKYEQADLYIHQSLAADLRFPLLNAMRQGLPIIAPNICWKDALRHLDTGYLYNARDRQALINFIIKVVHAPEEAFKLGMNAQKEFNETLSFEKTYEQLVCEF